VTERVASSRVRRKPVTERLQLQVVASEECAMSDLVVIVYQTEARAEEMRQKLFGLQKEYLIQISDAAIAVMHEDGKVKLNQLLNTTALGAASGGFWGLLIGAIFLMPIFGAALGAASGALGGALTDYGVNDAFMKELSASLQPGNAALFVLIQKMTGDKVLEAIKGTGGVVLKTSLDHSQEQKLRDALAASPAAQRQELAPGSTEPTPNPIPGV
jgi:uncharacterized membrane protein